MFFCVILSAGCEEVFPGWMEDHGVDDGRVRDMRMSMMVLFSMTMDWHDWEERLGHCEERQSRRKCNEEASASLPRAAECEHLQKIL